MTVHAGEDVEWGKHSSVAVKSANLYNHYENQYVSTSGRWELTDIKIQLY